jgi:hypothetical protein
MIDFMTNGLLISRANKNRLHKKSLNNLTPENIGNFKRYRNIYNSLIRRSRKDYYHHNLNIFKRNPKKMWSILKEAMGVEKGIQNEINDINVGGISISDNNLNTNYKIQSSEFILVDCTMI